MLVRPMTPGDAEQVAELSAQLGYPSSAVQIARRFSLLARDPEHALFVAQLADGAVIGWVHVHGILLMEADPRAEIWGLVVADRHRRLGIGQALMLRSEAWAIARGYDEMSLRSNTVRTGAHSFYLQLGYRIVKTSHILRKSLRPA